MVILATERRPVTLAILATVDIRDMVDIPQAIQAGSCFAGPRLIVQALSKGLPDWLPNSDLAGNPQFRKNHKDLIF